MRFFGRHDAHLLCGSSANDRRSPGVGYHASHSGGSDRNASRAARPSDTAPGRRPWAIVDSTASSGDGFTPSASIRGIWSGPITIGTTTDGPSSSTIGRAAQRATARLASRRGRHHDQTHRHPVLGPVPGHVERPREALLLVLVQLRFQYRHAHPTVFDWSFPTDVDSLRRTFVFMSRCACTNTSSAPRRPRRSAR
jgi:hypothetical protein